MKNSKKFAMKKNKKTKKLKTKRNHKKTKRKLKEKILGGASRNENHEQSRPRTLDIPFGIVTHQTIGDCIKDLIEKSYEIYTSLLASATESREKTTIVCGGQSPSYYCLSMMQFKCLDPEIVNIVILPHSMGGVHYDEEDYSDEGSQQMHDMFDYRRLLRKKNVILNPNVVIIDSVHSGAGIKALEYIIRNSFSTKSITKIAINSSEGVMDESMHVDHEHIVHCQAKFSDTFPRIITSFHRYEFKPEFESKPEFEKFITHFINLDNPIAQMIIDIARTYPETPVEDTRWFKLNNIITDEILKKRQELENFRQRAN